MLRFFGMLQFLELPKVLRYIVKLLLQGVSLDKNDRFFVPV